MARPKGGLAVLGELTGKTKSMSLSDLDDILGEKRPELPKNKVGRYRLIRSLRHRFGNGYRNIPGVKGLIDEFDEEIRFNGVLDQMKAIKPKRSE